MKTIPVLLCDYYKLCHHNQYKKEITKLVSYVTVRGSRLPKDKSYVINFGLQGFIKEYLIEKFNKEFFEVEIEKIISELSDFLDNTLGTDDLLISKIRSLHKLGYLPLSIRSIPEGEIAEIHTPIIELATTHPGFPWIGGFIESLISSYIWKPQIDANVAYWYRKIVNKYYDETTDDFIPRSTAMSEFGFRGADSPESGIHSGAAWLTSFKSTATCAAIKYHQEFYNGHISTNGMTNITDIVTKEWDSCGRGKDESYLELACNMIEANESVKNIAEDESESPIFNSGIYDSYVEYEGLKFGFYQDPHSNRIKNSTIKYYCLEGRPLGTGLASTEHSVMCSSYSLDTDEITHIKKLLTEIYPDRNFSMVSDSYDYWNIISNIIPELKDDILKRSGTLYVRGDSGDPIKIIAGYIDITEKGLSDEMIKFYNKISESSNIIEDFIDKVNSMLKSGSISRIVVPNIVISIYEYLFKDERHLDDSKKFLSSLELSRNPNTTNSTEELNELSRIINKFQTGYSSFYLEVNSLLEMIKGDDTFNQFGLSKYPKNEYYRVLAQKLGYDLSYVAWKNSDGTYSTFNKDLTESEFKGTVECLWDIFGGLTNSKGYKVLDDHIRAIYGDSITHKRAEMIFKLLKEKGFASNNVALGAGSFSFHCYENEDGSLSPYTRDTYMLAVKATYGEYCSLKLLDNISVPDMLDENNTEYRTKLLESLDDPTKYYFHPIGCNPITFAKSIPTGNWILVEVSSDKFKPVMIFKNPKTDSDNFKRSQRGCCAVYTTETDQNGNYTYYQDHDNLTYEDSLSDTNNKLELVFSNGKLVKETSIMEIRDRLHKGKF